MMIIFMLFLLHITHHIITISIFSLSDIITLFVFTDFLTILPIRLVTSQIVEFRFFLIISDTRSKILILSKHLVSILVKINFFIGGNSLTSLRGINRAKQRRKVRGKIINAIARCILSDNKDNCFHFN